MALFLIKSIALIQLFVWHTYFIYNGITTYEYIMEEREKRELLEKYHKHVITNEEYSTSIRAMRDLRSSQRHFRKRSKIIVYNNKKINIVSDSVILDPGNNDGGGSKNT